MAPRKPSQNTVHVPSVHGVEFCNISLDHFPAVKEPSHFLNFFFRNGSPMVLHSPSPFRSIFLSSLSSHVQNIVHLCANEKMIWSSTGRIVAFVTYLKLVCNWSIHELVSYSVGKIGRIRSIGAPTISVAISGSSPEPAAITLGNSLPKSNLRPAWIGALPRTVLESLSLSWSNLKRLFAGETNKCHLSVHRLTMTFVTAETLCWIIGKEVGIT